MNKKIQDFADDFDEPSYYLGLFMGFIVGMICVCTIMTILKFLEVL